MTKSKLIFSSFLLLLSFLILSCSMNFKSLQGNLSETTNEEVTRPNVSSEEVDQIKENMQELQQQVQELVEKVEELDSEYDVDTTLSGVYNAEDSTDGVAQTVLALVKNTSTSVQTVYGYTASTVNGEPTAAFTGAFADNKVTAMKYPVTIDSETKEISIDESNGQAFILSFEISDDETVKFGELKFTTQIVKGTKGKGQTIQKVQETNSAVLWEGGRINIADTIDEKINEIFNLE